MAEDFRELQSRFAAHLRDPVANPAPAGIEDRRLAIYRRLFFNNVENLLATGFPVLRSVLPDDAWLVMVRAFYAGHPARTPLFHKLAEEFVDWLDAQASDASRPWMPQLAHYEWVDLALATAEDPPAAGMQANPHGDLMAGRPLVSPLSTTLAYDWPVHLIGADFQPTTASGTQTYLIVYRNAEDEVKFMGINAVTARLLTLAEEQTNATGAELLEQIAEELQHPELEQVLEAGTEIFETLRERGIVLGTRRTP